MRADDQKLKFSKFYTTLTKTTLKEIPRGGGVEMGVEMRVETGPRDACRDACGDACRGVLICQ